MLARPLFSSGRRPPADDAVTGTSAALPRLSAILVSGALRRVVFETGDKQTVLGIGGHAGPYTVDSISAQAITVATQDGTRTLRPQALPDDGSTAAAAAAPRAPTGAFNVLDELRRGTPSTGSSPSPIQELIAPDPPSRLTVLGPARSGANGRGRTYSGPTSRQMSDPLTITHSSAAKRRDSA